MWGLHEDALDADAAPLTLQQDAKVQEQRVHQLESRLLQLQ